MPRIAVASKVQFRTRCDQGGTRLCIRAERSESLLKVVETIYAPVLLAPVIKHGAGIMLKLAPFHGTRL